MYPACRTAKVDGRDLPHKIEVRNRNDRFAIFIVKNYKLEAAK